MTNLQEFLARTNPLEPGTVFRLLGVEFSSTTIEILFSSEPGKVYRLESRGESAGEPWVVELDGIHGTGGPQKITAPLPANSPRFYRLF